MELNTDKTHGYHWEQYVHLTVAFNHPVYTFKLYHMYTFIK